MPPLARLKALLFPTTDPLTRFCASIIRRKKLTSRAVSLLPYFRTFLILAGFLYLLALPWEGLGRKHYVSENALQPGQVRFLLEGGGSELMRAGEHVLELGGRTYCGSVRG